MYNTSKCVHNPTMNCHSAFSSPQLFPGPTNREMARKKVKVCSKKKKLINKNKHSSPHCNQQGEKSGAVSPA